MVDLCLHNTANHIMSGQMLRWHFVSGVLSLERDMCALAGGT